MKNPFRIPLIVVSCLWILISIGPIYLIFNHCNHPNSTSLHSVIDETGETLIEIKGNRKLYIRGEKAGMVSFDRSYCKKYHYERRER